MATATGMDITNPTTTTADSGRAMRSMPFPTTPLSSRKRGNASRDSQLLMTFAVCTDYASPSGAFNRSPSLSLSQSRSPDLASPVYPDRAIRPLPKSRLKAKLSLEHASTIIFPPDPPPISPTLNFGSQEGGQVGRMPNGDVAHGHYLHHRPHDGVGRRDVVHDHCTCGEDGDSGDDEVEFDHPDYRYTGPSGTTNGEGSMMRNVQQRLMEAARVPPTKPPPPGSTASSADGYESFENTSNKKKRKIPLSSASSMHQSQLSAEMASMGISNGIDGMGEDGGGVAVQSYAPAANGSGTGISGAGRGRYGRQSGRGEYGVRRPLGSSNLNAVNGYRNMSRDIKGLAPDATGIENTGGIISQAIKSAAEQAPLTPQKGQDSASLLQSAASNATSTPSSSKTQFTFSVESESATKMVDQQAAAAAQHAAYGAANTRANNRQSASSAARGHHTNQATQTTPSLRQTANAPAASQQSANAARAPPNAPPINQQQAAPPKPRRRNPNREYAQQARQRRLQQEYSNYHHRPSGDNMWICEFCEYEDIFGVPPVALIRQYEIKDRQERKRAAERRRLLEKARAKGRKGKKGGKKGANNTNNAATVPPATGGTGSQYDPNNLPPPGEDPEYYDDEEYADEYGDEYEPVGADGQGGVDEYGNEYYSPPPPPAGTPQGLGHGGRSGG